MKDFPDVRQEFNYDCGAACAAAVCRFHGNPADLATCRKMLRVTQDGGTDFDQLACFFASGLFRTSGGDMDVEDLKHHTGRGRPVIALVRQHYVVVLSVGRGVVRYHDPESGRGKTSVTEFVDWWKWKGRRLGLAVW